MTHHREEIQERKYEKIGCTWQGLVRVAFRSEKLIHYIPPAVIGREVRHNYHNLQSRHDEGETIGVCIYFYDYYSNEDPLDVPI